MKSDSPPRVKSDVTVPGPPFCCSGQARHRAQRRRQRELLLRVDLGAGNHGHAVGRARQRLIDLRRRHDQRFRDRADVQRDVERRRRRRCRSRIASLTRPGALAVTRYRPASSPAKTNLPSPSERTRNGAAATPVRITSALATARPSGSRTRPLRLRLRPRGVGNNEERRTEIRKRGASACADVVLQSWLPPERLARSKWTSPWTGGQPDSSAFAPSGLRRDLQWRDRVGISPTSPPVRVRAVNHKSYYRRSDGRVRTF